jgi:hypothetical protein
MVVSSVSFLQDTFLVSRKKYPAGRIIKQDRNSFADICTRRASHGKGNAGKSRKK